MRAVKAMVPESIGLKSNNTLPGLVPVMALCVWVCVCVCVCVCSCMYMDLVPKPHLESPLPLSSCHINKVVLQPGVSAGRQAGRHWSRGRPLDFPFLCTALHSIW